MKKETVSQALIQEIFLDGLIFIAIGAVALGWALWRRKKNGRKTLANKAFRSLGIINIAFGLFSVCWSAYQTFKK
ncbi:hypothetical protein OGH69_02865 [Flavobacterium sp. MFBS3-15]|uniref:hypothetical protein n=1 Tax=Flavobacterium sp. MFBS3-15 TaxID=2989816 RepID=UPI0022363333|nr:hypothetical protein [Flavobacterium sp. MFBS3-15]MCW4467894.1 hypothetical protein [Flavobacterium sp. MFBS3-15]